MKIPGRAQCNCFLVKYIHNAKTGKFNRKQYIFYDKKIHNMKTGNFNRDEYTIGCDKTIKK